MSISIIITSIICITIIIMTLILSFNLNKITKEIIRKHDIESDKTKNDLYRVYMDLDLIKVREIVDNILNEYISRWVMSNITSQGDNYIKDQEVAELINYVTSKFIIEMSDVHLFYVKCLFNISDDDSLIYYIREEVKFLVLEFITDFNKSE